MSDGNSFITNLETVVYGCHAESLEKVRDLFESNDLFTFSFAEYFLDEPVARRPQVAGRKLFLPFLARAAVELKYQVQSTSDRSNTIVSAKTRDWLKYVRKESRTGTGLTRWTSQQTRIEVYCDYLKNPNGNLEKAAKEEQWHEPDKLATPDQIRDTIKVITDPDLELELSYDIQLHPWSHCAQLAEFPVYIFRYAIASEHTYYGHFAVTYQASETDSRKLVPKLRETLEQLALRRYVPTLVLLHASKWEGLLREHLENGKVNPATSPITLNWQNSSNEFESAFGRLWERRDNFLKSRKNSDAAKATVLRSIILDDHHIASPAMVDQVREVIRGAKLMQQPTKKGDPLPSALVFGEAGSGKDKMARLIPTLTEHYFTAPVRTHNMAAIKPTMIAVPMLFGAELPYGGSLPGVFSAGHADTDWAIRLAIFARRIFSWGGSRQPREQVFVLDELNSLDYDMQGSLLRLLENSEVARLFSTEEPEWINALIVGIVNEDPEEVTRENELRLLKGAEEFLGKAEAARLYDSLHHARRLRPDLVYRLKRGVYVRMPALRDRREDIPLLFKYPCAGHLKTLCTDYFGKKVLVSGSKRDLDVTVEYELEAFDALMRRELPWPGNIRQLQAVARKVADDVWDWWKNNFGKHDGGKVEIEVRRAQVQKVLREAFPRELGRGGQAEERPD